MKLLREPLVHFLALGAGLFVLFAAVDGGRDVSADRIEISAARVEQLAEGFARTWQRPPTSRELDGLIEEHVREEVFYREALAMGLDRDDTIVRRRMRQKLEFLTDDVLDAAAPTEEELRGFLAEHPETFEVPARLSFEHVYFNPDRRQEAAAADARRLLRRLESDAGGRLDVAELGDRLPLPRAYADVPEDDVARRFGTAFAEGLESLPEGRWAGPIESGYGLHLVRIRSREHGRVPAFEGVREAVEREWRAAKQAETEESFYRALRRRYEVVLEPGANDPAGGLEVAEVRP